MARDAALRYPGLDRRQRHRGDSGGVNDWKVVAPGGARDLREHGAKGSSHLLADQRAQRLLVDIEQAHGDGRPFGCG
jgi:hypothetical protein